MQPLPVNLKPDSLIAPAVIAGNFVFVSGNVGWEPETREAKVGIEAQTEQAFENLKSILQAAGTDFEHVVKVNIYLTHIDDFAAMNQVFRRYFPHNPPARTTVGAVLARSDLLVEIEMVALLPDASAS